MDVGGTVEELPELEDEDELEPEEEEEDEGPSGPLPLPPLRVGIITGTGSYDWPGMRRVIRRDFQSTAGPVVVSNGEFWGVPVAHLSRHGDGHKRLSNHLDHRAHISALLECGAEALISLTACGSVDPDVPPGTLVIFDDLYFPSNRLPSGELCTWYDLPGEKGRGHWIFDGPYSESIREILIGAARDSATPYIETGAYGHVDGPRFNTRAEIAALAACGVVAVSQTAGPEVVLAAEVELPMAVMGYVTDFANGVVDEPTP
ncbi:MAG: MTAP family purine nucleoside phosphorylase, partial [Acidimicrobiales bacterium]